jgi:predicted nucleic acid-binding protein
VDTSVLGAYYCPEPLSEAADAALVALGTPVISLLTEIEFASLVGRKRRAGDFTAAKAARILQRFDEHLAAGRYRVAPVSTEHYLEAKALVRGARHALRTLDALHLSVARAQDCELLTADRIMANAAKQYAIRTVLIS